MKFTLAVIAAFAALASAKPVQMREATAQDHVEAPENNSLIAGTPISAQFESLRFFEDVNFGGQAISISGSNNQCSNLVGFWNDRASSIQNQGGSTCIVYIDSNCSGSTIVFGPSTQISSLPSGWNDQASSYQCF
ncbi:hypothetical protein BJ878DRAFT_293894 [Calycina marina]|uniref:Uncharacterized protein n=1 Tax=Calycina marina TaxID=1763456 RepID=A0A9P8CBC0_9HELO|nr:hypothetical protein BJ878DRAFT_293894 [Calycina marina]